jgi:hypothetical protein
MENLRMTMKQARAVELLKKLGSDMSKATQHGNTIYVPLPFRRDDNPNVKVWDDGSWHDFSASKDWSGVGLKYHGTLRDLESAVGEMFEAIWATLPTLDDNNWILPHIRSYVDGRLLRAELLRWGTYGGESVILFPMVEVGKLGKIVGIQRRFIGQHIPKNIMYAGSDAKNGVFYQENNPMVENVYVCEGATDTFTDFLPPYSAAIGATSCSALDGVIAYLKLLESGVAIHLCFDADEYGQEAQSKVYMAIKDRFDCIYTMVHHKDLKDVNDEYLTYGKITTVQSSQIEDKHQFVTMVDELPASIDNPPPNEVNWVGFFPPDFPNVWHTQYPDSKAGLYIYPESYGRIRVNAEMWKLKKSAYILRGW